MSNSLLKKIVAGVSATAITLSIVAPVTSVSAAANAEIEAANKLAEAGIIQDNSANVADYKLGDNITRREMAKVMINLAGIEVTDSCEGKFADLPAGDWGCKYAEAALAKGFVAANPTFGADNNISKWESLKFILKAKGLEKAEGFGDDFQAAYVKAAMDSKVISESFTDYNTSAKRGWIFESGAAAMDAGTSSEDDDEDIDIACELFGKCGDDTDTDEDDKPVDTKPTDDKDEDDKDEDDKPTTPSDVEGKILEVSLSPDSPRAGERIPTATPRITMLKFDVAAGDEDVELKSIKMDATGFGDAGYIDEVVLYDANEEKVTRQRSVSKSDLNVELDFLDNFTVKAGTTQTLTVSAQIDSNAANADVFGLKITEIDASTSVEGTPIAGAELESVTLSNQGILVLKEDKATQKITIGQDSKLGGWKIKNDNDKEDITIKTIRLKQTGTVNESNIEGLYVEADGKKLAESLTFNNDYITVNFGEGYVLPKDKSAYVYFQLRGLLTGEPGDTVQFQIEKSDDLYAIGDKNGFNAPVTTDGTLANTFTGDLNVSDALDVEGSEITAYFTKGEKDASNVDADDFDFGTLKLKANSGNYNLEEYKIMLTVEKSGADIAVDDLLTDIRLGGISSENELTATAVGTNVRTLGANTVNLQRFLIEFKDLTLRKGEENEMTLTADIPKDSTKGVTYKFALDFYNNEFKLEDEDSDKTYTTVTGGTLNAKDVFSEYSGFDSRKVEVKGATLDISNLKVDSEDVVLGSATQVAYKGTIEAGSSADVKLRNITFTNDSATPATALDDLSDVIAKGYLKFSDSDKAIETTDIDATTVKFTSMDKLIKAGASNKVTFELTLLFKSANDTVLTNGDEIKLELNGGAAISAEDKEVGSDIAAADITGDLADVFSNTITLTTAGTLTIDVDTVKNDSSEEKDLNYKDRFVLAGTDKVMLAKLEMDAEKEAAKVKDLTFSTANFADAATANQFKDSIENVRLVKENKTTDVANATVSVNALAVDIKFEDMDDLTVETENKEVYYLVADIVKVDLKTGRATATSGLETTFTLSQTTDIEGDVSGKTIANAVAASETSKKVTLIASQIADIKLTAIGEMEVGTNATEVAYIKVTPTSGNVNTDADQDVIKPVLKKITFRSTDITATAVQGGNQYTLTLAPVNNKSLAVTLAADGLVFDNLNTAFTGESDIDGETTFVLSVAASAPGTNIQSKATVKLDGTNVEFYDGSSEAVAAVAATTETSSFAALSATNGGAEDRVMNIDGVAITLSATTTALTGAEVAAVVAGQTFPNYTAAVTNTDKVTFTAKVAGAAGNAALTATDLVYNTNDVATTITAANLAGGSDAAAAGIAGTVFNKVYAVTSELTTD